MPAKKVYTDELNEERRSYGDGSYGELFWFGLCRPLLIFFVLIPAAWLARKCWLYREELLPLAVALVPCVLLGWWGVPLGVIAAAVVARWLWAAPARERRASQRLIEGHRGEWFEVADACGLTRIIEGGIAAPSIVSIDNIGGGSFRLVICLLAGQSVASVADVADNIASSYGASIVEVDPDPRRANYCDLLVVGQDDPLYLGSPSSQTYLEMDPGRDLADPIPIGVNSAGELVTVKLPDRSVLVGGSPGSGKSVVLHSLVAGAALSRNTDLWFVDPKGGVELVSFWQDSAARMAINLPDAKTMLDDLYGEMEDRYATMKMQGIRKIAASPECPYIVLIIDEVAELTASADKKLSKEFEDRLRSLVSKGRAAGVIPILCTQKPSAEVLSTIIRDLTAIRISMRTGASAQSVTILGEDAVVEQGASPHSIGAEFPGIGYLTGESGGKPQRFRAFFLNDKDVTVIAARSAEFRGSPVVSEPGADDLPNDFRCAEHRHSALGDIPLNCAGCFAIWTEHTKKDFHLDWLRGGKDGGS